MANISLPRDNNRVTVIGATSSVDGITPVAVYADPTTHRLLVDVSGAAGTGTVTSIATAGLISGGTITTTGTITTSMATGKLVGRSTAGTGVMEEITVGSGLTLSAGTLSVAGGGTGDVVGPASAVNNNIALFNTTTGKLIKDSGFAIASTATASSVVSRDADVNIFTNNTKHGYTTTATAAGTTTLTSASSRYQYFTGTTTQTVVLPDATTLATGWVYEISNNSTGAVTVNANGGGLILVLASLTAVRVTCTSIGSAPGAWDYLYLPVIASSGKKLTVSNSLTLAGTDGTTMTFPSTSATIARTDAANTFTGVQTFSTPIAATSIATMTSTVGGAVPTPPNNTTTFLRGDGTFAAPTAAAALTDTNTTEQSPSRRDAWVFPDNTINAAVDIAATRFYAIKALWYELNSSGVLVQRNNSSYGSNFYYTSANAALMRQYSTEQWVTLSTGSIADVDTLTSNSTKRANATAALVAFCQLEQFTGVELDVEVFSIGAGATGTQWTNFKTWLTELGNALHAVGLKLMVDAPPIWNSSTSATPPEWNGRNSQGYYTFKYEEIDALPVDYLVPMAYDYQFDMGAGEPCQPISWMQAIANWCNLKMSDRNKIIMGLPAAGYSGATGGYAITGRNYTYLSGVTGFGGAARDSDSQELIWANAGISYACIDETAMLAKIKGAEQYGIFRVSQWYAGGNKYSNQRMQPITPAQQLPQTLSVASTPQFAGIDIGNSDTTLSRSSAGVIAVEGVVIPSISSTNTLTNKRITKRVGTTTSSATPTINTDNVDYYSLTAQTVNITSFTTNLSGTPTNAQTLWISITGTAARAITWGSSFESSTVSLPTTTVSTNRLDVGFIYNSATSKWRCVATA